MLDLLANGHEHIFIDEWEPGLFEEFKNELVKANDFNDQFLWIAFHRRVSMNLDTALVEELQSIFRIVQLEYSMRNSKAIVEYCIENPDLFQEMMLDTTIGEAPYNLPTGLKPKSSAPEEAFHHIVEMTKTESVLIVYLLNHDDEPGDDEDVDEENRMKKITKMRQIGAISQRLRKLKPSIEIGAYFLGEYLRSIDSSPDINIIDASDCLSYIKDKNGVLIVDEEAVEGFEWKTVYVTVPAGYFGMTSNIYMRCISNLNLTSTCEYPEWD